MIKYQYLRHGKLALTIATELVREECATYYSYTLKHPEDKFVKKEAIKAINLSTDNSSPVFDGWVEIDKHLTRNELLLAVLCDIYAKNRIIIPQHYRLFIIYLMIEYNKKVLMGM